MVIVLSSPRRIRRMLSPFRNHDALTHALAFGNWQPVLSEPLQVERDRLVHLLLGLLPGCAYRNAPRKVRRVGAIAFFTFLNDGGDLLHIYTSAIKRESKRTQGCGNLISGVSRLECPKLFPMSRYPIERDLWLIFRSPLSPESRPRQAQFSLLRPSRLAERTKTGGEETSRKDAKLGASSITPELASELASGFLGALSDLAREHKPGREQASRKGAKARRWEQAPSLVESARHSYASD